MLSTEAEASMGAIVETEQQAHVRFGGAADFRPPQVISERNC